MQDIQSIWNQVLEKMELRVPSVSFQLWIKTLKPVDINEHDEFVLTCPSVSAKNQVLRNFLDKIGDCSLEVVGKPLKIVLLDKNEEMEYLTDNKMSETKVEEEENPFVPKYTFDNFVVGKSNQFVYAAAHTVAENPGKRYNPLFIYGGVGLGKTHLLHAIGNYIREFSPQLKIMYVTGEMFTNSYIASLSSSSKMKAVMEFRGKYRNLDVLMVDDIQFIYNKKETQEEFFHTFNELVLNNKQVIICSDRPPKDIPTLEDRLRSRFSSGLIHDIQKPDIETRIAILHKKSQLEKYYADDDVINYIAENIDTNIRELEGKLSEVYFLASLSGKKVATMEEVQDIFSNHQEEVSSDLSADKIISVVCDYFNVSFKDITGKKKNKEIVEPRMIAIYLISDILDMPLASIGKIFGGRDHTTIIHSRDKIAQEMKENKKTQTLVNDIRSLLK